MLAAAKIGDKVFTGHLCTTIVSIITTPAVNVFINGIPAAVVGAGLEPHTIKSGSSCVPHPNQVVNAGSSKVFINGIPAARIGDSADLGTITSGSPTVFMGG